MDIKKISWFFLACLHLGMLGFLLSLAKGGEKGEESDLFFVEETAAAPKVALKSDVAIPFPHYVVGKGKVHPSETIVLSPKREGIVKEVLASPGQVVKKGDLLLKLDRSPLECALKEALQEEATTVAKIRSLEKGPSEYQLKAKEHEIDEALLHITSEESDYSLFKTLAEKEAVTKREVEEKRIHLERAKKEMEKLLAEYESLKEGRPPEEIEVAKGELKEKRLRIESIEEQIADCSLRSPIAGRVLSTTVHQGSFAKCSQEGVVVIGSEDPLHLVVSIDEQEAWRILPSKHLRGIARHKSNPSIYFVLKFLYINPVLHEETPGDKKLSLVFSFDKGKIPVYFEQEFDVWIEATAKEDTSCLDYQFHLLDN